jgi:hypothetical protein
MNMTAAESLPTLASVLARMRKNDTDSADDLSHLVLPGLRRLVRSRINTKMSMTYGKTLIDVLSAIGSADLHTLRGWPHSPAPLQCVNAQPASASW